MPELCSEMKDELVATFTVGEDFEFRIVKTPDGFELFDEYDDLALVFYRPPLMTTSYLVENSSGRVGYLDNFGTYWSYSERPFMKRTMIYHKLIGAIEAVARIEIDKLQDSEPIPANESLWSPERLKA